MDAATEIEGVQLDWLAACERRDEGKKGSWADETALAGDHVGDSRNCCRDC